MGFYSVNMDLNTTQPFHFMLSHNMCLCVCFGKVPPPFLGNALLKPFLFCILLFIV